MNIKEFIGGLASFATIGFIVIFGLSFLALEFFFEPMIAGSQNAAERIDEFWNVVKAVYVIVLIPPVGMLIFQDTSESDKEALSKLFDKMTNLIIACCLLYIVFA
ncbi:hypothetical protein SL034_004305 [Vibrio harveyi]|uniref:hypothetical protein n=1 Tax=Vibrio harveyi group TaxID=717610 RepID=UPI000971939D|nr:MULTISPECIES: hypothetical protein [Vibrio harveyi group]ELY1989217.1 hypothetical protein [Vibrio harveyi]APX10082.1 hypothetical protein BWP24_28245 [Vibrio campbellii]ARR10512.1 unknow [Vibrio campbellii]WCP78849.1 hypothetical protein PPW95_25445 [Vibrio parahaemolyticus]WHP52957.1 hypothetical protein QMY43_24870 [Vibrio parahaemolyticus]